MSVKDVVVHFSDKLAKYRVRDRACSWPGIHAGRTAEINLVRDCCSGALDRTMTCESHVRGLLHDKFTSRISTQCLSCGFDSFARVASIDAQLILRTYGECHDDSDPNVEFVNH